MSFKVFKRKDFLKRNSLPQVYIRVDTLAFNAELTQKAKLAEYGKVKIFIDEENYRLGFKFHNEEDEDSLRLYSDGPTKSNRVVSARQLLNTHKWIGAITKFNLPLDKRFTAVWDNIQRIWVIDLCPPFENTVSKDSQLKDIKGIYRYKRGTEIVYIGKGNIKSRIASPEREVWDFDTIEYSIIERADKQSYWEAFWLDRYAKENGRLPFYNKVMASK